MSALEKIKSFYPQAGRYYDRLNSVLIELRDIAEDQGMQSEQIDLDPKQQELVNERIDLLNNLLMKHAVQSVKDLIDLRNDFQAKILEIDSYDDLIAEIKTGFQSVTEELDALATRITAGRIKAIPEIEKTISGMLKMVGIPNAKFKVLHDYLPEFTNNGRDKVGFMFSANKQTDVQEIAKVASGGELSRLMLSIKSLLSDTLALPTIIFDEVDAGVSGDIAEKVANIMKTMSSSKQVINITHLPQIAGKGDFHYLVYKYDQGGASITDIRRLDQEERVLEIAKMLSGEELTEAAISNARELLN
jgi:DNA repair protein RecN (Recombination protein N)